MSGSFVGRLAAFVLLVSCGTASAADAPPPTGGPATGSAVARSLDAVMDAAARDGFSGEVAAIGPGLDYARAVGLANRATGAPLRPGMVWPWASVTKQVTAALVMREVDRGRLGLDTPIRAALPDFTGPTADRVTIRHLLRHQSGLPNPEDTAPAADGVPAFYRETGAAVGHAARAKGYCAGPPVAEPGAAFSYNNCDYLVLGAVLERTTGRSYAALIREILVEGADLRSLRLAPDGRSDVETDLVGYLESGAPEPARNLATYGAGGALLGTARDLLAFDAALWSHRIVSPDGTAAMWEGDPKLGYAALGAWSYSAGLKGCTGPMALVERRGAIGGIQVRNLIAPALKRAVVAFSNDTGAQFGEIWQGSGLAHDLAAAVFCGT